MPQTLRAVHQRRGRSHPITTQNDNSTTHHPNTTHNSKPTQTPAHWHAQQHTAAYCWQCSPPPAAARMPLVPGQQQLLEGRERALGLDAERTRVSAERKRWLSRLCRCRPFVGVSDSTSCGGLCVDEVDDRLKRSEDVERRFEWIRGGRQRSFLDQSYNSMRIRDYT